MFIAGMSIDRAPMFKQPIEFSFDKRANLFIGPNATGKTSLLRMLGMPVHAGSAHGYGNTFQYIGQFAVDISDDWPVDVLEEYEHSPRWSALPWVQICSTRIGLPWSEKIGSVVGGRLGLRDDLSLPEVFRHGYDSDVFDAHYVEVALRLLVGEALSHSRRLEGLSGIRARIDRNRTGSPTAAGVQLHNALSISYACARQITSEIIIGSSPHNLVSGGSDYESSLFVRHPEVRLGMAVDSVDGVGLPVDLLSSGTQSSLLWVRFLALQMLYHYDFEDGWEKQPAILLIDEIENHLHPTWQRRVIPTLLDHFPGLQIFATTHSPFVVAGLKAGQVHLLKRENGVVSTTTNTENIEGWTADEILRVYMGVGEPTDERTAQAAQQLRRLRDEGPRADEQEENERQSEIAKLRQIVDRATLSGPRTAEDARFLANLEAILERYQQTQDLNQENG